MRCEIGDCRCFVPQTVKATEWQLCWAAPGSDTANFGARAILPLLLVNPQPEPRSEVEQHFLLAPAASIVLDQQSASQEDDPLAGSAPVPPPLPVPWTVLMSAAHLQLTVLASACATIDGAASSPAHEAAVFDFDSLQVSLLTSVTTCDHPHQKARIWLECQHGLPASKPAHHQAA